MEMASPIRNPKDLKTIISTNDGDSISTLLERLDMTPEKEVLLLRSRIDEQGQLICVLKKRADEYKIRNQTGGKINGELGKLREHALEEIKMAAKRSEMLEMRFNELAYNHEEMIKFKDEHKRRNEILVEQNTKLLRENQTLFSSATEERDTTISKLKSTIQQMKKQARKSDEDHESATTELRDTNLKLSDEVETLKSEVKQMCQKFKLSENALSKAKAERDVAKYQNDNASLQLKKENDLLLEQVMQRGKLLQERQLDVEMLQQELERREDELVASEENFKTMEDRVNVNSRVGKLQAERDIVDAELTQLKREYEAYKAHTNKLLEQEKDLNYKLRKNILS